MKQYLLNKLHEIETKKDKAHKMPNHATGLELRKSVIDDLNNAMDELVSDGLVQKGRCINDSYFALSPENALD